MKRSLLTIALALTAATAAISGCSSSDATPGATPDASTGDSSTKSTNDAASADMDSSTPEMDSATPDDASTPTDSGQVADSGATDSGGDGGPSALCTTYCNELATNCTGANAQYTSNAMCLTGCAAIPATGKDGDQAGNTIQCRIYHGGTPAMGNPTLHCPHAGPTGGGTCV